MVYWTQRIQSNKPEGTVMKWGILATGTMTLEVEGKEPEVIRCPVDINGFEYEIREASRCVKLGRTGSDRYTPQDSLALIRLIYDTRMSWGMKFAGEV